MVTCEVVEDLQNEKRAEAIKPEKIMTAFCMLDARKYALVAIVRVSVLSWRGKEIVNETECAIGQYNSRLEIWQQIPSLVFMSKYKQFVNMIKKSLTTSNWQNGEVDTRELRRTAGGVWHCGAAGRDRLWRVGAGHAGGPENGPLFNYERYRRQL